MRVSQYVKCLLFLCPVLTKIDTCRQMLVKISNTDFKKSTWWKSSCPMQTDRRT
jgi:hypothetical protein